MNALRDPRPLVAHIMFRFDVGGLENGVVNLLNHMPGDAYRHAVIALTDVTDFRKRVLRDDVQFISLAKAPGHAVKLYPRLFRLFRELRPEIVHTRNLAALEAVVPAWAAGVPVRIHGEHGRDIGDFDGSNRKLQWVRRLYRPFVTHYIAVSADLERYLTSTIRVPAAQVDQIYNGVDARRFHPEAREREPIAGCPFRDPRLWLVGSVGRMHAVKDPLNLARAFIRAFESDQSCQARLRLIMIGDGPLRAEAQSLLNRAGLADRAWLPGERSDVPAILRGLDCFVLPSRGEGISNTILEAMASGLPVIATDVGGNNELVESGRTGELVPAANAEALAQRLLDYLRDPGSARSVGAAGRKRIERHFTLDAMVQSYQGLYDRLRLADAQAARRVSAA